MPPSSASPPPPSAFAIREEDLRDAWRVLTPDDRAEAFQQLHPAAAESFFNELPASDQSQLLAHLPAPRRKAWIARLEPDDAADVIQEADPALRQELLACLNQPTRLEVNALLAYAEDHAGGLMNTRFAKVRPDMTIDEAIRYLRLQARDELEIVYYAYVLDGQQHLQGVVSVRELFRAAGEKRVKDVMMTNLVSVPDTLDQEEVAAVLAQHDLLAVPVLDADGRMKGIVTHDDIVDVVTEEATEDIHKMGGQEALDVPYFDATLWTMIRKRGGWLALLFVGELLTASAMKMFEEEIARAVVLALFIPLIISSGGNAGSQATTLIIRAMALGEVALRDWWRVVRRELFAGLALGVLLAALGVARIGLWAYWFDSYGQHAGLLATAVGVSLIGVVTWGTLAGSMLPFILRRVGFDPASASAPFVATLVDVAGLVIYFTVARAVMFG